MGWKKLNVKYINIINTYSKSQNGNMRVLIVDEFYDSGCCNSGAYFIKLKQKFSICLMLENIYIYIFIINNFFFSILNL